MDIGDKHGVCEEKILPETEAGFKHLKQGLYTGLAWPRA